MTIDMNDKAEMILLLATIAYLPDAKDKEGQLKFRKAFEEVISEARSRKEVPAAEINQLERLAQGGALKEVIRPFAEAVAQALPDVDYWAALVYSDFLDEPVQTKSEHSRLLKRIGAYFGI